MESGSAQTVRELKGIGADRAAKRLNWRHNAVYVLERPQAFPLLRRRPAKYDRSVAGHDSLWIVDRLPESMIVGRIFGNGDRAVLQNETVRAAHGAVAEFLK